MPRRKNHSGGKRRPRGRKHPSGKRRKGGRNTKMRLTTARLPTLMPDRQIQTFKAYLQPVNVFTSAAGIGNLAFYMNSMGNFYSGSAATYEYYADESAPYIRTRVLKSRIKLTFSSRETTKYQTLLLVPSRTGTAVSGSGFTELMQEPYSKSIILSPLGSAGNIRSLSSVFNPEKVVGTKEYFQQDEYAILNSGGGDPTTLLYWQVAYNNPDINTVTTGGLQITCKITQTVEMYELQRGQNFNFRIRCDGNDEKSLADAIEKLEIKRIKLNRAKSLSKLDISKAS